MADKKISQLSSASTPLAGTEVLPIVQSSTTVKVSADDLTVKNVRSNATTGILQIAGPAAAATRVMTVPDANFTSARTDAAQTFTGNQTLGTGNLVMGTADKGIDFSANSSAAGMTSELLNDYEEGTWTPVATARSGSITSYTSSGNYTKIGNRVFYSFQIVLTDNGTGSVVIDVSLPFVVGAVSGGAGQNVNTAWGLAGSSGIGLANVVLSRADGTYPGATGNTLRAFGHFIV